MTVSKSIMPRGTRLIAIIALALAVCLMAWRATTHLTENNVAPETLSPGQAQLTSLLDPVFGQGGFRLAVREGQNEAQTFLILLNGSKTGLDADTNQRVTTILEAAAGYDAKRDRLEIQSFAFAPGTDGTLTLAELAELGGLATLCLLLAWLSAARSGEQADSSSPAAQNATTPFQIPENQPVLRAVPLHESQPDEASIAEARRLARDNPGETARILRSWMQEGDESA